MSSESSGYCRTQFADSTVSHSVCDHPNLPYSPRRDHVVRLGGPVLLAARDPRVEQRDADGAGHLADSDVGHDHADAGW